MPSIFTVVCTLSNVAVASPKQTPTAATESAIAVQYAAALDIPVSEAVQRLAWQEEAGKVYDAVAKLVGTAFGDMWTDPSTGHKIIGYTGSPPTLAALKSLVGTDLAPAIELEHVQWSKNQLDAVSDSVGDLIAQANSGADVALGANQTPSTNRVNLLIPDDGTLTAAQQAVVNLVIEKYPDEVSVQHVAGDGFGQLTTGDCSGYVNCNPPLRAADRIHSDVVNGLVYYCTAAFIARSVSDSKWYVFTAGHCLDDTAGAVLWWENFANGSVHQIGREWSSEFGPTGDDGIININNPSGWGLSSSDSGVFMLYNSDADLYPITSYAGSGLNDYVCDEGSTTHQLQCGGVGALNQTVTYVGGVTVKHLGVISGVPSQGGDSGGPVVAGHNYNQARGLISGSNGSGSTYFQGISAALTARNVYLQ